MPITEDTRARLARLVAANPRISTAELVRQTGVTRQRVHQILDDLDYELVQVWRKKKRGKA